MDSKIGTLIVSVLTAIIGVSTLAVILSKNANTANVFTSFANGFSQILGTALSPITGGSSGLGNLNNTLNSIGGIGSAIGSFGLGGTNLDPTGFGGI
jgi:hypothetical protein